MKFNNSTDIEIFHSGTKCIDENIVTNGGRVLSITSRSSNLKLASGRLLFFSLLFG